MSSGKAVFYTICRCKGLLLLRLLMEHGRISSARSSCYSRWHLSSPWGLQTGC